MKKLIVLLIPLILLTGCMYVVPTEGYRPIIQEQGHNYQTNDFLLGLNFNIPEFIDTDLGVIIEVFLTKPDKKVTGVYSDWFYPVEGTCFLDMYDVRLYFPGRWEIDYKIYEGYNDASSILKLEGSSHFYVLSNSTTLSRFEVTEFNIPDNVQRGDTIDVSFTVKNTGHETGLIYLLLFNDKCVYDNETHRYECGEVYYRLKKYLEDDDFISETISIKVDSDIRLSLYYNGYHEEEYISV